MRVFLTGASGWIGTAIIPELLTNGHTVLALARSDSSAESIKSLGDGVEIIRGTVIISSGTAIFVQPEKILTEMDNESSGIAALRAASEKTVHEIASGKGISIRLPLSVHGKGDKGFVRMLIGTAREKGASAYIGEGKNRWPAVHRFDAAILYRLALEKGVNTTR